MRKLIFREGGIKDESLPPNGYRFIGYDKIIFSEVINERGVGIISPIGGNGSSEIESLNEKIESLNGEIKSLNKSLNDEIGSLKERLSKLEGK